MIFATMRRHEENALALPLVGLHAPTVEILQCRQLAALASKDGEERIDRRVARHVDIGCRHAFVSQIVRRTNCRSEMNDRCELDCLRPCPDDEENSRFTHDVLPRCLPSLRKTLRRRHTTSPASCLPRRIT